MDEAPCIDCEDRQIGCHGRCERYQMWQAEHLEAKRKEYDERRADFVYDDYQVNRAERVRRRKYRRTKHE